VVEHSPTAVFIYNRGRLIFGNPRLYELLGRTQAELDRMDPIEVLHPEDRALVAAKWSSRLMGDPEPPNTDYRLITPGGMRWINGRGTLVQYRGETMVLGNFQDVTERHVMEQALRNSKLAMQELTSRMLTAQEDERRRVALDLHDSIGQSLSAIKFMVERAVEEFADGDPAKPLAVLRATVPVIQKSVEEVRHISMGLRPSTLDDLGLLATLDWFSREFQTTYPHIQVHKVRGVEEAQIPDGLKTSIFRIHQEAMNNAAKHSQATRITVALRHTGDQLQLAVQDDGQGFDPAATPAPSGAGGFGLASMRERAEFLGGTFTLTSSQGQGTQVLVQWPVGLVSY